MFPLILVQILILVNITFEKQIDKRMSQLEFDPLINIAKEFSYQRVNSKNSKDQMYAAKKSKYKSYLQVSADDPTRNESLNEFLAFKIYQYADKINMMTIPEYRIVLEGSVKIIKNESPGINQKVGTNQASKIGTTSCNLEQIAHRKSNEPIPVCPWHWVITERESKYPFKRANAKCNCENCQAKTIYDSDVNRLSSCQPENILMPVLIREKHPNNTEKWWFSMEEVPTSCICSLKLNPQI